MWPMPEAKGQLEVHPWEEAYIKDNHFDQYRMLDLVREAIEKQQPGEITRFVGNMEWALQDLPGVHDLLEYETRLNEFLPQHRDPVVCCYDISRFDAGIVIDIMRTHRWSSSVDPPRKSILCAARRNAERITQSVKPKKLPVNLIIGRT